MIPQPALQWLLLAISSLLLGGLLSLGLVISRAPLVSRFITDPLFAKRVLVIHVNLTLTFWFLAFGVGLYQGSRKNPRFGWAGILSIVGICLTILSLVVSPGEPILSNYIPIIDSELFMLGLALFTVGVAWGFWPSRPLESQSPFKMGVQTLRLLFFWALAGLCASFFQTDFWQLEKKVYFEQLFWGVGHILQFFNVALIMTAWNLWNSETQSKPEVPEHLLRLFYGLFWIPILFSITFFFDSQRYISGFTWTMQWFSWPSLLLLLVFSVLVRAKNQVVNPLLKSSRISVIILMGSGIFLGMGIRDSNTLIPAHYHLSLGAVTVALMGTALHLFERRGWSPQSRRLLSIRPFQPLLFCLGQGLFSVGFAVAGIYGQLRKTYGTEQRVESLAQWIGLTLVGMGGLIAIVAGGLFFAILYFGYSSKSNTLDECQLSKSYS